MSRQLSEILQKRMDRKDFLKHVGMGVVVLTGLAGIIKLFHPQEQPKQPTVASGYGASVYGGRQAPSTKV